MDVCIRFRLTTAGGAVITDGMDNEIYIGKGNIFSLTNKKRLLTMDGKELYTISNKFWNAPFTKSAIIKNSEGKVAQVRWGLHNFKFVVKDCADEYVIQGRFLDPNFIIYKNGVVAANARSEFSLNGLVYFSAQDPAEVPFLLALIIAMDNIRKDDDD